MTECPLCSGVESECPCPKGNEPALEPIRNGQEEEEAEVAQERDDAPAQPAEDGPAEVQPVQDDPAQEEHGEQAGMGEAQAQPEEQGQGQGSDDTPADGHGERVGSADARLGPEFQVSTVPAYQGPPCTDAWDRGDQLLSLAEASEAGPTHESAPPAEVLVGVLPSLVRAVVLSRAAAHKAGHPPAAREVVAELELRMGMPQGSLAEQLVPIARAAATARLSLAGSQDCAAPVLQTMTQADVARRHALRHARRGDEEEDLFKGEEEEVEVEEVEVEAQQVELKEVEAIDEEAEYEELSYEEYAALARPLININPTDRTARRACLPRSRPATCSEACPPAPSGTKR